MKKVILGLVVSVLFAGFAFSASAAIIGNVGDSSLASSLATWLIKVLMTNNNGADIKNNVTSSGNSGGNSFTSADDQSGTVITTGNASAVTLVDNNANNNMISEEYESSNGADNTIDTITDESVASASSDDTLDNNMENANSVHVLNDLDAESDSGSNVVVSGDSLQGSSATTGASDAATGVSNVFNINIKDIIRRIRSVIP